MRRTAGGIVHILAASAWLLAGTAQAQVPTETQPAPTVLTGTLLKAHNQGEVAIGYRGDLPPFSFVPAPGSEPRGYSIELCRSLAHAMAEAVHKPLRIRWVPLTAASRIPAVEQGQVDLECGTTTSTHDRQQRVAFSPLIFVSGTRLLVPRDSTVQSLRDLAGQRVSVTAGTTNEQILRDLAAQHRVPVTLVPSSDHDASFSLLARGQVQAFATDEVLLYVRAAQSGTQRELYRLVGDRLSYEPYAIMFRKGDPAMAAVVADAFHEMARNGEIERQYRQWFMRKLPFLGITLGLPMSTQLRLSIETLASNP
ncbi:MAG TPA: amino acid ABC transporter substrate-binding protein [Candidatus Aquabacterium excrementipullorum]|nr:amino acid ABC transporter substrate-binding protein [Candidatus Aquabacterium excrementipullorum]